MGEVILLPYRDTRGVSLFKGGAETEKGGSAGSRPVVI
jgi:hypothetical protein